MLISRKAAELMEPLLDWTLNFTVTTDLPEDVVFFWLVKQAKISTWRIACSQFCGHDIPDDERTILRAMQYKMLKQCPDVKGNATSDCNRVRGPVSEIVFMHGGVHVCYSENIPRPVLK